jgi:hypothetical protein
MDGEEPFDGMVMVIAIGLVVIVGLVLISLVV